MLSLTLVEKSSSEVSSQAVFIFTLKPSFITITITASMTNINILRKKLIAASLEMGSKNAVAFYFSPRNSDLECQTAEKVVSANYRFVGGAEQSGLKSTW